MIIFIGYVITVFCLVQAHSTIAHLENQARLNQPDIHRREKEALEERLEPSIKLLNRCVYDIRRIAYKFKVRLYDVGISEVVKDNIFKVGEFHEKCTYLYAHLQDFKLKQEVNNE
jgi:hypothetical protein